MPRLPRAARRSPGEVEGVPPHRRGRRRVAPGPSDGPGCRRGHARAPAADLPQVPGYELFGEVGRGGMGVVYRARDLSLDRDVAVKLLQDRYPANSPLARRFTDEARITGQLQHPGIPAVYQVGGVPDGRPFLAMKLMQFAYRQIQRWLRQARAARCGNVARNRCSRRTARSSRARTIGSGGASSANSAR